MTAQEISSEIRAIVDSVLEFFSTHDEGRRKQLDEQLSAFKTADGECERRVSVCLHLLQPGQDGSVQFFGAIALYDTIRHRWEQLVETPQMLEQMKEFLVNSLSHQETHSTTINSKLTQCLALLILYCIPDVWPNPLVDLTSLWVATPAILLSVVGEIAAQFHNIQMPLKQRSTLKTELNRMAEDVTRIVVTLLTSECAPECVLPAVDCVDNWLRLPGISLSNWKPTLSTLFGAVHTDTVALTKLLNVMATSDELPQLEKLFLEITAFITARISTKVLADLSDESEDNEDTIVLIQAVCALCEAGIPCLIKNAMSGEEGMNLLRNLCSFFSRICTWPGVFAQDEAVSDLPQLFFSTLREDLQIIPGTEEVVAALRDCYAALLTSSVNKLAYPPKDVYEEMDKEQREQFKNYRLECTLIGRDAFDIVGADALRFLTQTFVTASQQGNVSLMESSLMLWESVADYLTEREYEQINELLSACRELPQDCVSKEGNRLFSTFMCLLYSLSHLLFAHPNYDQVEKFVVSVCLAMLSRPEVCPVALQTLDKFCMERLPSLMESADVITSTCYAYFMERSNPDKNRLDALRCIGHILSMQPENTVLETLGRVVGPAVEQTDPNDEKSILFQIGIFNVLFATIRPKEHVGFYSNDSPIVVVVRQAFQSFLNLLSLEGVTKEVQKEILDAVRTALFYIEKPQIPEFFPVVTQLIDRTMETEVTASASTTLALVLNVLHEPATIPALWKWLSEWVQRFESSFPHPHSDEWITLIYQIFRKHWKVLREHFDITLPILESTVKLCTRALCESQEPAIVQRSSQTLGSIASNSVSFKDDQPKQILASHGELLIKVVFERINRDLIRATVEALADVLYFFAANFTQETRACLSKVENGDTPLVQSLFNHTKNARAFKQNVQKINLAARRDRNVQADRFGHNVSGMQARHDYLLPAS